AEAHASGIPLVAPDMGGASDFVGDAALGFTPADTADVVRAILELPSGARKAPPPRCPRSMDEHFRDLYRIYAGLGSNARMAVAGTGWPVGIRLIDRDVLSLHLGTLGSVVGIIMSLLVFVHIPRLIGGARLSGQRGFIVAQTVLGLLPEYGGIGV